MPRALTVGLGHAANHVPPKAPPLEGKLLSPGDKYFGGRIAEHRDAKRTWEQAHDLKDANARIKDNHDRWDRESGKAVAGVLGIVGGTSLAAGAVSRKVQISENTKLRRKLGVKKSWKKDAPFLWHAEKTNGAHKVTIMGEKAKAAPKKDNSMYGRMGRWTHPTPEGQMPKNELKLLGSLSGAAALGVPLVAGPAKEREKLQGIQGARVREARRLARQQSQVAKGRNPLGRQPFVAEPHVPKEKPPGFPADREWDYGRASHDKRQAQAKEKWDAKEKAATAKQPGIWTGKPHSGHWREHVSRGQVRNAATSGLLAATVGGGLLLSQHNKEKVAKEYPGRPDRGFTPAFHREKFGHPDTPGGSQLRGRTALGKLPRVIELANSHDENVAARARKLLLPLGVRASVGKRDLKRDAQTAAGATAAGATMDTLNTVGGQSTKAILKERRNHKGYTPRQEAAWADHKKKVLGIPGGKAVPNDDSVPQHLKAKLYRTMPKGLPDRTANRLLAFKNTKGWTTGSLVGAALVGGKIAHGKDVNKSIADETRIFMDSAQKIPRAAARAGKKSKAPREIPDAAEIARRRAEKEAQRAAEGKVAGPAQTPKASAQAAPGGPPPPDGPKKRSSFLGPREIKNIAYGGGAGLGLLSVGRSQRKEKVGKREQLDSKHVAGGLATGAVGAHMAEGHQLHRVERELHRVLSANNADGVGQGDFHPDQPRIDRGLHGGRALSRLDNAKALRSIKGVLALSAVGALATAPKKKVAKLDDGQKAKVGAGALGGAALLDAADVITGASLKRIGVLQRDQAKRRNTPEKNAEHVKIFREHAKKHGFLDPSRPTRGMGTIPVDAPHAQKHKFYRSYPTALPSQRANRLNALRDKKTGPILATGALLGGAYSAHRQAQVSKGAGTLVAVGAGTGLTGLTTSALQAKHHENRRARETAGATVGGWAAQGVYQGAGYGYRNAVRGPGGRKAPAWENHKLPADEDHFPDPEERAKRAQNAKERAQQKRHHPRPADAKRNTPDHWHGARMERLLGRTHAGKTGMLLGGGLTVGGALAGAHYAGNYLGPKTDVKKDVTYGYMESRRSKARTAELGIGLGLAAHGASRLQVGPAVARGVRFATVHGKGKQAKAAVARGRKIRNSVSTATGHAESGLRNRIPGFGTALDKIPEKMRPTVTLGSGAYLAARATPTHDERFVPTRGYQ